MMDRTTTGTQNYGYSKRESSYNDEMTWKGGSASKNHDKWNEEEDADYGTREDKEHEEYGGETRVPP